MSSNTQKIRNIEKRFLRSYLLCKSKFSFVLLTYIFLLHLSIIISMKLVVHKIPCPEQALQLKLVLGGGQSFRWLAPSPSCGDYPIYDAPLSGASLCISAHLQIELRWKEIDENKWRGVFASKIWTLSRDDNYLYYEVHPSNHNSSKVSKLKKKSELANGDSDGLSDEDVLRQYLRLDVPLKKLYTEWSERDPLFKRVSGNFHGVRMLRQDVIENIFSFICSSNNNIIRISSMVEKLCLFYGKEIGSVDGVKYHSFPNVSALADSSVEAKLRNAGFGYRAKFIQQSAAKIVAAGEEEWLSNLQKMSYSDAKKVLMTLTGIGAKVADCICLMSLNHLEAIPVDTHVFQIAQRYLPHLRKCKTVTDRVYNEIGEYFRTMYGEYAGWAHTILFCADLKKFQGDLPPEIGAEIKSIKRSKSNGANEDLKSKKSKVKKVK